MYKKDFPVFQNNPDLIFLDTWASSQKPKYVIDWVSEFTANSYANIHRWAYELSEKSEELYDASKELVWEFLNCKSSEVIYTYNSTYGINLVSQALVNSNILQKWDTVLLWIWEHHANVLPRQVLAKQIWFDIQFVEIDQNYEIDRKDFQKKCENPNLKVVSIWHVSNVTWKIYDMKKVKSYLKDGVFFMIDGSQSFPNFKIDVEELQCDSFIFTWHKAMAYSWIWVVYLKKNWIKTLEPMILGWWTIKDVSRIEYSLEKNTHKFEAGTPNIIWAVSLLKALEYIKSIGWIQEVRKHEQELVDYVLPKFEELSDKVKLIWPKTKDRVAVFSFFIPDHQNFNTIWEHFAEHNIAIRCGWHCAYPLHKDIEIPGTCRASAYLYNTKEDMDKFFETLKDIVK